MELTKEELVQLIGRMPDGTEIIVQLEEGHGNGI